MNRNLVPAEMEQDLAFFGGPIRCCRYWPECSHMLDWLESVKPCPDCDGEGCSRCKGSGMAPASNQDSPPVECPDE